MFGHPVHKSQNWNSQEKGKDHRGHLGKTCWEHRGDLSWILWTGLLQSFSAWKDDCSPPGSSAHGILQARILERVAVCFSRGTSQAKDGTWSPASQADSSPSELPGERLALPEEMTNLRSNGAPNPVPSQAPINHFPRVPHTLRRHHRCCGSHTLLPLPSGTLNTAHYQPRTAIPNPRPQKLESRLSAEHDPSSGIPWKVWLRLSWLLNAASLKWKPPENMFSYKIYKELCFRANSWKGRASSLSPDLISYSILALLVQLLAGNQKPER